MPPASHLLPFQWWRYKTVLTEQETYGVVQKNWPLVVEKMPHVSQGRVASHIRCGGILQ